MWVLGTESAFRSPTYVRLLDKPELFEDAPVGLQLIGKSQEEEAVIAMTEIVDTALKRYPQV